MVRRRSLKRCGPISASPVLSFDGIRIQSGLIAVEFAYVGGLRIQSLLALGARGAVARGGVLAP